MKQYISSLLDYFNLELPRLRENYQWKIPKIDGFDQCKQSEYSPNVRLKMFFNKAWGSANNKEQIILAKQIVVDWGQVKNNKPETLKYYVDEINKPAPCTPLKGIASYSKIFSVVDLNKYAIYDARVAACLNAVQWNYKIQNGVAFNYISGRNNITGHATKKIGFVYQDQFKIKSLINNGWSGIRKDDTYDFYLDTLKECLAHFPNYKLYDLEMALFSNAVKECKKAMNS